MAGISFLKRNEGGLDLGEKGDGRELGVVEGGKLWLGYILWDKNQFSIKTKTSNKTKSQAYLSKKLENFQSVYVGNKNLNIHKASVRTTEVGDIEFFNIIA